MKKIITAVLSLVMAGAMSVTAFASNQITSEGGSDSKDVKAIYVQPDVGMTVYSVDISWGSMEFTYTPSTIGTWNPSDHTYGGNTNAKWECQSGQNEISVTNHSNSAVDVELAYTPENGLEGITGSFENVIDGSKLELPTAENTPLVEAPTASASLILLGALDKTVTQSTKIGTVTVTLSTPVHP